MGFWDLRVYLALGVVFFITIPVMRLLLYVVLFVAVPAVRAEFPFWVCAP